MGVIFKGKGGGGGGDVRSRQGRERDHITRRCGSVCMKRS